MLRGVGDGKAGRSASASTLRSPCARCSSSSSRCGWPRLRATSANCSKSACFGLPLTSTLPSVSFNNLLNDRCTALVKLQSISPGDGGGMRGEKPMILRQFLHTDPVAASYLFGCGGKAAAAVVDPVGDIAPYLAAAKRPACASSTSSTRISMPIMSPPAARSPRRPAPNTCCSQSADADFPFQRRQGRRRARTRQRRRQGHAHARPHAGAYLACS